MGRGRLPMKLIEKEKLRKTTFQKRKNGIMKKADELSTLCGVDCCLIVYSPNSINDLPEIWPQDRIQVLRIIEKYKAKIAGKSPKKYNMTEFFKDKKNKVEAKACKLRQERLHKLYPTRDFTSNKLSEQSEEQLRMFVATLDSKVEDCEERIKILKKRYIEEKQQQQIAELSSDKSSASDRSHLIFSHNNNSGTAMLSAHNHQTLDFLDSKVEDCEERIKILKKRYIEEKQQQQQIAELSSDKSSASNRSHPIFSHNNNSGTAMLSAHNHQTLDFLDSKVEDCEERIKILKKRYIEEKQQHQIAELSSDKSSALDRSHLIFSHNNNISTAMLSAHNHQTLDFPLNFEDNNLHHRLMLQPFHPNLMPFTMVTPNDFAETAFDHYDLMMRESYCPSSSWCYSSSSNNNNNNNYSPNYLQNMNNNILQIHPHEVNLQGNNNIPEAPLMMQEFQSYHHFG